MQAIAGIIVAVSCFGAAYAAQMVFPVQPIADADLLLTQSTVGTVNFLDKESLQEKAKTPRELIRMYRGRAANLADVLELVTGKTTVEEAYRDLLEKPDPTPEDKFLIQAAQTNYGLKAPPKDESPLAVSPDVMPTGSQ